MTSSKDNNNALLLKACDIGFSQAATLLLAQESTNINYTHPKDSRSGYNKGLTPLHVACRSGHLGTVKTLFSNVANRSSTTDKNDDDAPQKLILNVTALDAEQWNALHYACFSGHDEIVKLLVDTKQFDLTLITMFEKATAQGFAEHRKFKDCVRHLSDKNVDNNKLFVWTPEDVEENLTKCIKKLKQTFPSKISGVFLFRYEMTIESYKKLDGFLKSFLEKDKQQQQNSFVVLDARDVLLHKLELQKLKELEYWSPETEKGALPMSGLMPITPVSAELAAILNQISSQEDDVSKLQVDFIKVKLIFHVDFEKHRAIVKEFSAAKNSTVNGFRFLRASSINGLEHFIVLTKIHEL
jgi:hypothetical protein